ncbi:MAG: c-type cytochrome, partial [bacterium]
SPQVKKLVADKISPATRPEIREFLERFLPRSARIERLGDGFSPDEVLSLSGDAGRGADLFFANSGPNCVSCHAVGGKGRQVGPDLDGIGKKYDRATLLKHLVEPSWAIEPQYRLHNIATKDGRVFSGIRQTLPDGSVKVTDAKADTLLKADEVDSSQPSVLSLMPAGILRDLTAEQAADLLAYLAGLNKPAK